MLFIHSFMSQCSPARMLRGMGTLHASLLAMRT